MTPSKAPLFPDPLIDCLTLLFLYLLVVTIEWVAWNVSSNVKVAPMIRIPWVWGGAMLLYPKMMSFSLRDQDGVRCH
jgi:hypothetical protein